MRDMFERSKFSGNIDNWVISEAMLKSSCHPKPNYDSIGVQIWKLTNL